MMPFTRFCRGAMVIGFGLVIRFDRCVGANFFDADAFAAVGRQAVDAIGVTDEMVHVVVADHQDLEPQRRARFLHDSREFGDEVGVQPAVLLVENEELAVASFIECCDCEHTQTDRNNVRNRTALTFHDVFGVLAA